MRAGTFLSRQVTADLRDPLETALDGRLTGYLRIASEGGLLLESGATVLTFEDGVPRAAFRTDGDTAGADALADAAVAALYRIERYELSSSELATHHDADARVPPALPAEQLVGDGTLVSRTREHASGDAPDDPGFEAVHSFLEDQKTIATIRERARTEARERADSWDFPVAPPEDDV
jgi:hypothetical protein